MDGLATELLELLSFFAMAVAFLGLIVAVVAWARSRRIGPSLAIVIACGLVIVFVNPGTITSLANTFVGTTEAEDATATPSESPEATSSPAPTQEPTPSPTPQEPQVPESTTNWGEVWMIVGIIAVSLIVLIFAAWLTTTLVRRSRVKHREYVEAREKAKAEKARLEALRKQVAKAWEEAVAKHDKLDAEYLSYQKDLSLIARYPLMTDLAVPLTKKAVRAMTEARNQKPLIAPEEMDAVDGYRESVTSFELALRAAVLNAKREGLKNFSEREQKDLRQVQDLLRMAEDKAGSPHERRSAYERAIKTLQSILGEVPQDALLEIEARAKEDGIMLAISA